MTARRYYLPAMGLALGSLLTIGCGTEQTEEQSADSIEARLSADDGGYDEQNEVLYFDPQDIDLPAGFDYDVDRLADATSIIDTMPELDDGVELEPLSAQLPSTSPSTTAQPPRKRCEHVAMKGRWKRIKPGFGVYRGVIAGRGGKIRGFVKGIWGRGRFIGKAVGKRGRFWAILKGLYGKGHFKGRFRSLRGVAGGVRGRYTTKTKATGKGSFAGVIGLLCRPHRPRCLPLQRLDICPARVKLCKRVTLLEKGKRVQKTVCRVRCAPPKCVARRPRPTRPRPAQQPSGSN